MKLKSGIILFQAVAKVFQASGFSKSSPHMQTPQITFVLKKKKTLREAEYSHAAIHKVIQWLSTNHMESYQLRPRITEGHLHPRGGWSPIFLCLWPHSLGGMWGESSRPTDCPRAAPSPLVGSCCREATKTPGNSSLPTPLPLTLPPAHTSLGLFKPLGSWIIAWHCFEKTFCICFMAYSVFWKMMYSKQFLSILVYILCFSFSIYIKKMSRHHAFWFALI